MGAILSPKGMFGKVSGNIDCYDCGGRGEYSWHVEPGMLLTSYKVQGQPLTTKNLLVQNARALRLKNSK